MASHRTHSLDSKISEQLLHHSETEGTEWDNHVKRTETMDFVNNNTLKPDTLHEIVNNRMEHLNMEAHLMHVNNDTRPENEEPF